MSHGDDDAEDFFFAGGAGLAGGAGRGEENAGTDAPVQTETADEQQRDEQHAQQQQQLDEDAATTKRELLACLLTATEICDLSQQLRSLALEAPKALTALLAASKAPSKETRDNELQPMSAIDLRRQQQQLSECRTKVLGPLGAAVVRWEEDVVRHRSLILEYRGGADAKANAPTKREREAAGLLDDAIKTGDAAVSAIHAKMMVPQLERLVRERHRELRLADDLISLSVWSS